MHSAEYLPMQCWVERSVVRDAGLREPTELQRAWDMHSAQHLHLLFRVERSDLLVPRLHEQLQLAQGNMRGTWSVQLRSRMVWRGL